MDEIPGLIRMVSKKDGNEMKQNNEMSSLIPGEVIWICMVSGEFTINILFQTEMCSLKNVW